MSSWLEDYLGGIEVRDSHEKANEATINAYTKLADHAAAPATIPQTTTQPQKAGQKHLPIPPPIVPSPKRGSPAPAPITSTPDPATVIQLRTDLSQAQSARTLLAIQNADLSSRFDSITSNISNKQDQYNKLKAQYDGLSRRLQDRGTELDEKRKMLERVQDEMVGLEMQLNVAEQEKERLRGENADLVKRLVKESDNIVADRVKKDEGN